MEFQEEIIAALNARNDFPENGFSINEKYFIIYSIDVQMNKQTIIDSLFHNNNSNVSLSLLCDLSQEINVKCYVDTYGYKLFKDLYCHTIDNINLDCIEFYHPKCLYVNDELQGYIVSNNYIMSGVVCVRILDKSILCNITNIFPDVKIVHVENADLPEIVLVTEKLELILISTNNDSRILYVHKFNEFSDFIDNAYKIIEYNHDNNTALYRIRGIKTYDCYNDSSLIYKFLNKIVRYVTSKEIKPIQLLKNANK
jgi:hypothetical protein